ncbi:MAG: hypothetical protein JWP92_3377 [Caulobacter sp.]|nr:hypothetical protein [Caulobacter sp.]
MLLSTLLMAAAIQLPSGRVVELPTPPRPSHRAQAIDGSDRCWSRTVDQAAAPTKPSPRRLGELPRAARVLTVFRTENGCPTTRPNDVRYVTPGR